MKVVDAGPEFRAELEAIGAKMTDEWLATVGEDGQEIVDAFKAN